MGVVEVEVKRHGGVQCAFEHFRGGHVLEAQLYGAECGGGDGQEKFALVPGSRVPISKTSERPKWVRVKRRNA